MFLMMIGVILALTIAVLFMRERARREGAGRKSRRRRKVSPSLQDFLSVDGFHADGAMRVSGQLRKLIRVGDMNLYSMSEEEIVAVRERFRETLKRLDNPFQMSVQARRANYSDFLMYAQAVIDDSIQSYANPVFTNFAERLKTHLQDEALKPRTDRENLIVLGVLPKIGGEEEKVQLERLEREQGYVEAGLSAMELPYDLLDAIGSIEAIQNFWNRERAMSQRYRDAFARQTHAPQVEGAAIEVREVVQT